jgi:5-methylcytosine-specific restriction endonuclease McrA
LAYNSTVLGLHNYYKVATHVSEDFSDISYEVRKSLKCRARNLLTKNGLKSKAYTRFYGGFKGKTIYIKKIAMFPISFIKTKPPMCFSQKICNYTEEGRQLIHEKLQAINLSILDYLLRNPKLHESTEYNDNRISLYVGQYGKCFVSGERLSVYKMEVHHKVSKILNGGDEYENLVFITADIHKLVHMTDNEAVQNCLQKLNLDNNALNKLNQLRKLVGNCKIV